GPAEFSLARTSPASGHRWTAFARHDDGARSADSAQIPGADDDGELRRRHDHRHRHRHVPVHDLSGAAVDRRAERDRPRAPDRVGVAARSHSLPRMAAFSLALLCLGGLTALEKHSPVEPFVAYYGGNHVSNFARSGVDAVSELMNHGFMESDPDVGERLRSVEGSRCRPTAKPPHIILVHDESSFDIRMAPGIKLPS